MDAKTIWKSKTFWGGVVLFLGMGLKVVGIEITPEEQAAAPALVSQVVDSVTALVGFVMVIYGRKNAVQPIK